MAHARLGLLAAVALGFSTLATPPARAATPDEVDAAIKKAVGFLRSQEKNGSWETEAKPKRMKKGDDSGPNEGAKWGGETAIATYALLAAGEKPQDPEIAKAIKWLMDNDLHGTYAVGLRSQIWNLIPETGRTKQMDAARDRDRDFDVYSRIQSGKNKGFYGYSYGSETSGSLGEKGMGIDHKGPSEKSWYDRSNSQYGVLGAWAVEQAGAEVPTAYWEEEDKAWKKAQHTDGGWNYQDNNDEHRRPTYTMTSAGIATLFITQDYVMRANSHQFDTCKGGLRSKEIELGLSWMDRHINEALTGNRGGFYFYGLYGIERIGVASGRKYFGTVNWYEIGAEALVRSQGGNGSWGGTVHDTCFGLLFLARGRAPVMMNKLQYAERQEAPPWNERPRDSANLAKWMGRHSIEGWLNWQVVNLKVSVDDLHDAPILYIAGNEAVNFSKEEIEKLRLFVEQGGMILGNADCDSAAFSSGFKKLGNQLFPKYEFRKVPNNHPIFNNEEYLARKWKTRPVLEGMSNGVRELMILMPFGDPARAWQSDSSKTRSESFELAGNIFLYAVDKENLQQKGQTYIVHANGPAGRVVKVARIEAGDNFDPEPGAWRRLSAVMHNEQHIDLTPEPVKPGEGKLDPRTYPIAALTGTTKLVLGEAQRKEIKDYVEGGGTLIIDAAGGSTDFADTAEAELRAMFGPAASAGLAQPLGADDPAFANPKLDPDQISFRHFARNALTGKLKSPRIRGLKVHDRTAVFFSREDLTGGLVGEPVDGVLGYSPETATRLMQDLVMFGITPR